MKKFALVCAGILISVGLHAEEVSYTNVSKYMLNNAYVQSPVYTKKMFRSIRETDTYNYQAQLAQLDMLKENRQISTREYNEKKTKLDQEFNKIYGNFNPQTQAATIKKSPVESFYYGSMKPGERLNLISLSSQELSDSQRDTPTPQMPVLQSRPQSVTAQNPLSRRSIEHLRNPDSADGIDEVDENYTIPSRQITPSKRRSLGEKAIPVKIGAF